MTVLEDALRFPYADGRGVRSLLIGSVLALLSVLVVPVVLLGGYSFRVVRAVRGGASDPPAWDDWGDLFVDGLRAVATTAVYLLFPGLLVAASAVAFVIPVAETPPRVVSLVATVVALASVPLFVAAAYALPAALVFVATSRRLGDAVAFRRVWRTVSTADYAVAWLLAVGVSFAASVVTGIALSTVVGGVLGAVVEFYALVVTAYLFARGVDVEGATTTDSRPTERLDA